MSIYAHWCSVEKVIERDPPECASLFHYPYSLYSICTGWHSRTQVNLVREHCAPVNKLFIPMWVLLPLCHLVPRWEGELQGWRNSFSIHLFISASFVPTSLFFPSLTVWSPWKDSYQLSLNHPPVSLTALIKLYRLLGNTFNSALSKELQTVTIWYIKFLENIRRLVSDTVYNIHCIRRCIGIQKSWEEERTFILQMREKYLLIPFVN